MEPFRQLWPICGAPSFIDLTKTANRPRAINPAEIYQSKRRDYDPTKYCGLINESGKPCLGPISCSNHEILLRPAFPSLPNIEVPRQAVKTETFTSYSQMASVAPVNPQNNVPVLPPLTTYQPALQMEPAVLNAPPRHTATPMFPFNQKPLAPHPLSSLVNTFGLQSQQLDVKKKPMMFPPNKYIDDCFNSLVQQRTRQYCPTPNISNKRGGNRHTTDALRYEDKRLRLQPYRDDAHFANRNDRLLNIHYRNH